ncbi:hypothetical protein [Streptomyces sp. SID13031]|uniref:hypothetical protein n=1 Tax=Streptomyces sp. SID13031 TaxID=2706046 RepID=UPI0013C70C04|nr:hypothetical protein [Streptomyces sp. SID13031]NEA33150.1 hypothetical protein [Streptomyces sp. SID13031]
MSSQDFPTYGRGENPDESREDEHYAKPAPYGGNTFGQGTYADPSQPGAYQPQPGPYQSQPGQPGTYPPPGQPGQPSQPLPQYGGPGQYGEPQQPPEHLYNQPPAYRPGTPYGTPAQPQPHELPAYGREGEPAPRDPRAARVILLAAVIAAVYGLLVISIQRVSLRDISQLPGSPLNHPLRTDAIDTIGQLLTLVVGLAALGMWLRDVLSRRKVNRQPDPIELGGLGLVALSLIPLLIWLVMVLTTGMGSIDDSLDRLPTAYAWGGVGLLMLAAGLGLGYNALKPPVRNPVVQQAPDRPPWE